MQSRTFLLFLHLHCDYLTIMNTLSKKFQTEHFDFWSVKKAVSHTKSNLNALKRVGGPNESKFYQEYRVLRNEEKSLFF